MRLIYGMLLNLNQSNKNTNNSNYVSNNNNHYCFFPFKWFYTVFILNAIDGAAASSLPVISTSLNMIGRQSKST